MKIFCVLATTATFLLCLVPARADTVYPTPPCRVFADTGYTQIAEQCGTVLRPYPRRLFTRAARRPWYCYGPEGAY
jgi:hypothetical protein